MKHIAFITLLALALSATQAFSQLATSSSRNTDTTAKAKQNHWGSSLKESDVSAESRAHLRAARNHKSSKINTKDDDREFAPAVIIQLAKNQAKGLSIIDKADPDSWKRALRLSQSTVWDPRPTTFRGCILDIRDRLPSFQSTILAYQYVRVSENSAMLKFAVMSDLRDIVSHGDRLKNLKEGFRGNVYVAEDELEKRNGVWKFLGKPYGIKTYWLDEKSEDEIMRILLNRDHMIDVR